MGHDIVSGIFARAISSNVLASSTSRNALCVSLLITVETKTPVVTKKKRRRKIHHKQLESIIIM